MKVYILNEEGKPLRIKDGLYSFEGVGEIVNAYRPGYSLAPADLATRCEENGLARRAKLFFPSDGN